jgi:hypothetical protein
MLCYTQDCYGISVVCNGLRSHLVPQKLIPITINPSKNNHFREYGVPAKELSSSCIPTNNEQGYSYINISLHILKTLRHLTLFFLLTVMIMPV